MKSVTYEQVLRLTRAVLETKPELIIKPSAQSARDTAESVADFIEQLSMRLDQLSIQIDN